MKTCPICNRDAEMLVINVQDGSQFCPACAPGSFDPRRILTVEDVTFLEACGVDAELGPTLRSLVKLWTTKDSGES